MLTLRETDLYLNLISHISRDGNSMLFPRPHSSFNQHASNFFPWSIRHWNKLPGATVNIKDNNIFKSAVCNHLVKQEEWFYFLNFILFRYLFRWMEILLLYCIMLFIESITMLFLSETDVMK